MFNKKGESQMQAQQKRLENINRQLRIQDVLSVLITQSTKLIELVNANQKEVNRLKVELDHLKAKEVV
jgi:flagellar basal body L-ring protein FlgH